jgi:diadenosine tetraphosphate (Ap4A) HIT family hydrolase
MLRLIHLLFTLLLAAAPLFADKEESAPCAFCNPAILDYQQFYEDDLVIALYTHKPVMPGHCLIIPKRHVERFEMLSDEESLQIFRVIKK